MICWSRDSLDDKYTPMNGFNRGDTTTSLFDLGNEFAHCTGTEANPLNAIEAAYGWGIEA